MGTRLPHPMWRHRKMNTDVSISHHRACGQGYESRIVGIVALSTSVRAFTALREQDHIMKRLNFIVLLCIPAPLPILADGAPPVHDENKLQEQFGEQQFSPKGGFLLSIGRPLPSLVWEHPDLVAKVVDDPTIPTRWFNERFEEVASAKQPGRFYVYGEAPAPDGPPLRRAIDRPR